jgi:hypothetical protein
LKPSNFLAVGDQLKLASDTVRPAGQDHATSTAYDVWNFGATLVEALTTRARVSIDQQFDVASLPAGLPATLVETVQRCLSPTPADRPSIIELRAENNKPAPVTPVAKPEPPVSQVAIPAPSRIAISYPRAECSARAHSASACTGWFTGSCLNSACAEYSARACSASGCTDCVASSCLISRCIDELASSHSTSALSAPSTRGRCTQIRAEHLPRDRVAPDCKHRLASGLISTGTKYPARSRFTSACKRGPASGRACSAGTNYVARSCFASACKHGPASGRPSSACTKHIARCRCGSTCSQDVARSGST